MRLIDADLLMEKLNVFNDTENGNEHFLLGIETAKELLADMPAAYDVEKVVEQIEKAKDEDDMGCSINDKPVIYKKQAIEIVKAGGISGKNV